MKMLISVTALFFTLCSASFAATLLPSNGVISSPGQYYLASPRSSNGGNYVINITASNVDLDLNGQIVQCSPPSPSTQSTFGIIAHGTSNVTIRNGWTLGCRQGISVLNSTNPRIESMKIHARHRGVFSNNSVSGLIVRGSEFYDIAGATDQAYAIGIDSPGSNCLIERNVFRNLHRQAGVPSGWAGEGVGVIFSTGSTGCVARQNWHENSNMNHLEIGYWVGSASVLLEENTLTNIGRAIAVSPGWNANVRDNRFWMKTPQSGSYAIGAQQGVADGNVIIGYDTPVLGNIADTNSLIIP